MSNVIDYRHLPIRFPVTPGVVLWLLLDRTQPPGWAQGVCWTIYGIWVILKIVAFFMQRKRSPVWSEAKP